MAPIAGAPGGEPSSRRTNSFAPAGSRQIIDNVSTNVPPSYIPLLGSFTGDIWHVAAAQILWGKKVQTDIRNFPFPEFRPVTAITVPNDKGPRSTFFARGQKSYDYLKDIGLECIVVALPTTTGTNMELLANGRLTSERLDALSASQKTPARGGFSEIVQAQVRGLSQWPAATSQSGPIKDDRLIPLWASTSVVMQLVSYLGVKESQDILGTRLCQGITPADEQAAQAKFKSLSTLIGGAMQKTRLQRVVLFNYRIGEVNQQHNSNPKLLESVTASATAGKAVVVCIAAVRDAKTLNAALPPNKPDQYVFDLFGVRDPNPVPFQDKRVTVRFWRLVAEQLQLPIRNSPPPASSRISAIPKCVVGLVGGRSGSMDLPAFVGVNCLSWDEPLFEGGSSYSPAAINTQMPQLLRLMNEGPLMSVGFLDYKSKPARPTPKKGGSGDTSRFAYTDFQKSAAWNAWFAGPQSLVVNHPISDTEATKAYERSQIEKYLPLIEKVARRIQAINIRAYCNAAHAQPLRALPPPDVNSMEFEPDDEAGG